MGELTNIVGLPPFYFQYLFKRPVNKLIQEYMKLRRLAKAAENAGNTEQRILDVALDYDFVSYASSTRAFEETYGVTPEEYRRDLLMPNTFDRSEVSMNYVLVDEGVPLVVGNIVLEVQRKMLVEPEVCLSSETEVRISEQIPVGESTGVDVLRRLWKRYHMEKTLIVANINTNVEMGTPHIQDTAQGLFTYLAGSLIQNILHHQQEYLVKKKSAAGGYIVCRIEAENFEDLVTDALNQGGKYLFGTWLPHHNLTTKPFSVEGYYRDPKDMICTETWVKPLPSESKK